MYTKRERIVAGICLCIATASLVNLFFLKEQIFGLSTQRLSVISFIPLGICIYFIQARIGRDKPAADGENS